MGNTLEHRKINIAVIVMTAVIGMMVLGYLGASSEAESQGTDGNIEVFGEAGGGTAWNEVHGFVITEGGDKVEEEFNITLCEEVKQDKDGKYFASGHIYNDIQGINWADEPEHALPVSEEDFNEKKQEERVLELYVLGEYSRDDPHSGGEELRQAYKDIQVIKPNHAPTPIIMVTHCDEDGNGYWDNWSVVENNGDELVYYIDSEGVDVQFWFNGSQSYDIDGDNVTEFRWDFGDGNFGSDSRERKMNTTIYWGEGEHLVGLIVGDDDKYSETPLDLRIIIRQPIRYPDLSIDRLEVVNKNGMDEFEKGDSCVIRPYVKNIGDLEIDSSFSILVEYWEKDLYPEPTWTAFDSLLVDETLEMNGLKLIDLPWNTEDEEFTPGLYAFRVTLDVYDDIRELRDMNNIMESETVDLKYFNESGEPLLTITEIDVSSTYVKVNKLTHINVTVDNTGERAATFVDFYYYINGEFQFFRTIDYIGVYEEGTLQFSFSPDTPANFTLHFEIVDNGEVDQTSDDIKIEAWTDPVPPKPPKNETKNSEIPLIYYVAGSALIIVPGITAAIMKVVKKKDDMVW